MERTDVVARQLTDATLGGQQDEFVVVAGWLRRTLEIGLKGVVSGIGHRRRRGLVVAEEV